MFAGGPGFAASYMTGDAELLSDTLQSYLIDPHGSGSSTPPADPADYSPEGHARFYEEARQALGLPRAVVLGHSFGATPPSPMPACSRESTRVCVAVAAFGIGPDSRRPGGRRGRGRVRRAAGQARRLVLVQGARPVMDGWTERILAASDPAEMEQMMIAVAAVLPGRTGQARGGGAALPGMSRMMKADLAAGKAWEGGLYQSVDLRPSLGRIQCPTLVVAGELDFICGPAGQARPDRPRTTSRGSHPARDHVMADPAATSAASRHREEVPPGGAGSSSALRIEPGTGG